MALESGAATYHVDQTAGNASNTGTSPTQPWKSASEMASYTESGTRATIRANELAAFCEAAGVDFERGRTATNRDGEGERLLSGIGVRAIARRCIPISSTASPADSASRSGYPMRRVGLTMVNPRGNLVGSPLLGGR